ncbi:MAG: BMP family ABC transporter substrate-binding protein [Spirochaetales bacterium]|jgi:basic membrane protein A|nr:BMP family ABC transporter substrate-binding protein [Spirochaetales bacterium]
MLKGFKTLVFILVVLLISTGMVFAGGAQEEAAGEGFIAAMATDVGGLGDKSFNDGSYQGLLDAQSDFGIEARVVESKQQTDYVPNLMGLAEDGAEVVFAVGFLMADAMIEAAQNAPDACFAGIDIWVDPSTAPDNVLGILFKEQESGYLAGVVAGLLTKQYASASTKLNDDNVVGMVLGMDIPPVERFQAGFYAGVKSVNPDCEVLSVVTGSFVDQAKGKEAALAMIEQGADFIFQIAGLTGIGAINAARESGILAIGVDVDQSGVAPATVLTSAVKGITSATYLTIKAVLDGEFVGGDNKVFGINEGATGLAPFHNFDSMVPAEVKAALEKAIADLKSGKIVAPATRAEAGYEG